ncbi:mRNA splicing protein [Massospora cicadina]|nr:mRNA splicing protein [Massospora cicadina]
MPVDPMEPPKFRHKKVPTGPPSPPAPVLHSPPRKVTAQEQKDWYIPPSERMVREEIKTRSLYQQKVAEKEKMQKEESLRALAQQARENRANFGSQASRTQPNIESEDEDAAELQARQELRREKQKERERELRLSRMGAEQRAKYLSKNETRDISEKVALGLAKPTMSRESMFDSRLFNQSEGINSGFRDEEAYSIYDKALFNGSSANMIYRPKKNMEDDEAEDGDAQLDRIQNVNRFGNAFGSSKAFQGADVAKESSGPKGKRGLDTSRSHDDRASKRDRH